MGKRLMAMVLASLLAMAPTGLTAEKVPQESINGSTKKRVKVPAASDAETQKPTVEKSARKTPKKRKSSSKAASRKSAPAAKKSASTTKKPVSAGKKKASAAKNKKSASTTKKLAANKAKGRLPRYYGRLKLTDEQRIKVLMIQRDYEKQIQSLRVEIQELESSRDSASREVLSSSQRELLAKMTTVAKAKTKKKR